MKREKTVIDVEVSEEKQREIVSSLMREHTNVGMKFERERTRQEEMVSPFNLGPVCTTLENLTAELHPENASIVFCSHHTGEI